MPKIWPLVRRATMRASSLELASGIYIGTVNRQVGVHRHADLDLELDMHSCKAAPEDVHKAQCIHPWLRDRGFGPRLSPLGRWSSLRDSTSL
jgi:hypothetical protein